MKYVVIAVVVIAALGVAGFKLLAREKTSISPIKIAESTSQESPLLESLSQYIKYSDGVLEKSLESNRVLFFYANWCPTCRPADKEIDENENKIPDGYVVIRVNYNDTDTDIMEKELANKYSVTYQHTFIEIDKSGEIIQSWNGGDFDMLLDKITR